MMKLDVLAIAAHPDDAELSCSGTLALQRHLGYKTGILDLTRGELGSRGTVAIREAESKEAAKILGLEARDNAGLADGFFQQDRDSVLKLVTYIREWKPEIVLINAPEDRHPDHGRGAAIASEAFFLAGLRKVDTYHNGEPQEAWRPQFAYHYIQDRLLKPDFVVDITTHWETKINAVKAYKSQFHDPLSTEPATYISSNLYLEYVEARAIEMGHSIGVKYGEGFIKQRQLGVDDLFKLK